MGRRARTAAAALILAAALEAHAATPFTVEVQPEEFVEAQCPQGCAPALVRIKGECYIWEYHIVFAPATAPSRSEIQGDWVLPVLGQPTRIRIPRDGAPSSCHVIPPTDPTPYPG